MLLDASIELIDTIIYVFLYKKYLEYYSKLYQIVYFIIKITNIIKITSIYLFIYYFIIN